MTAGQIEHPVADVLRVLAVSRSSGALEIRGRRSGTFFLYEGDITYAEALGMPPAEEFDASDPRLRPTIQSSIVEVGLTLLAEENVKGERPLFRPGRRHWSGRAIRVEVDALLSEIAQQMAGFAKLGIVPDDQVQLCGLPPGRLVVLDRRQWALAAEISGPQTARALARRSGSTLSATIKNLASLVAAGVVEREAPARPLVPTSTADQGRPVTRRPLREPPTPSQSNEPPTREPPHRQPPLREPPLREPQVGQSRVGGPPVGEGLPRRVRGATSIPPGPGPVSGPGPGQGPGPGPGPGQGPGPGPGQGPGKGPGPGPGPGQGPGQRPGPGPGPGSEARARMPPRRDPDDGGHALALRLLEGLRRL